MDRRYGPNASHYKFAGDFISHANEKLRILGEIPLRKFDSSNNVIYDSEGNPDTSFLVKIPADTPFTFQTLDRNGMILNASQTWHQVRPGEVRTDCGGCHAHSQMPLSFATTVAASASYRVKDLSKSTLLITRNLQGVNGVNDVPQSIVDVEFYQDIRPLLQQNCISCHDSTTQAGALILDDTSLNSDDEPSDYVRLADDQDANYGYSSVIPNGKWRQTNASRYIRQFQSRRSLLVWKVFGERLDGWVNADHPTETIPGDANTLPSPANYNDADLDFVASTAHPVGGMVDGQGGQILTMAEKMTFARWVDLGAPIDISVTTGTGLGWFVDDVKPTLTISKPKQKLNTGQINKFVFGIADVNSGIDFSTLSVKANFSVNGNSANSELKSLAVNVGDGIYEIQLNTAIPKNTFQRHLKIEITDNQGNIKRTDLLFYTLGFIQHIRP
ncbi:MAG: hypothetical protein JKX98_10980 [Alcanivoracaceae bacterium]|nr:hypothetical protein [Alcanivoracaceae bacterium]